MIPGDFYKFATKDYAARAMVSRVQRNLAKQGLVSPVAKNVTTGLFAAALAPPMTLPFLYPAAVGLGRLTRGSTGPIGRGIYQGTIPVRKAGLFAKRKLKRMLGIYPEGWVA